MKILLGRKYSEFRRLETGKLQGKENGEVIYKGLLSMTQRYKNGAHSAIRENVVEYRVALLKFAGREKQRTSLLPSAEFEHHNWCLWETCSSQDKENWLENKYFILG